MREWFSSNAFHPPIHFGMLSRNIPFALGFPHQ
jgi:hypothetical protein